MPRPLWLRRQSANTPIGINVSPSPLTLLANQAGNTVVATLTELGGTGVSVVFSVTGNANLTVVGNTVKTVNSPSFSGGVNQSYSLHVTDTGGTYNDPAPRTLIVPAGPSGLTHTPDTVLDNATLGTVVSNLGAVGGTPPYSWVIVSGFGGFLDIAPSGTTSQLTVNASGVGHLTPGSLAGNVRATDAANLNTGSVPITVTVSAHVSAPTGITQSPASIAIAQTQAGNATLATLTEIGGSGVSVVFSVIGNTNLTVVGNALKTVASPSFTQGVNQTYTLSVTDTAGTFTDPSPRTLTVYAAPTGISQTPSPLICLANQGGNMSVGTLGEIGGSGINPVFSVTGNANLTVVGTDFRTTGSPSFTPGVNQTYTLHLTEAGGSFNDPSPRTMQVPAGPSAISFSSSPIASNIPAGTTVGTLSTTGGTPPDVYVSSNGKFDISGNVVVRSVNGTLQGGLNETINFTATDAAGLSTNTATNGQGPFTITVTNPSSLSIPLTLNNLSSSVTSVAPFASYGHPFGDGDIPVGGSVTMTDSNSNPVVVQMDAVSFWPSGSPRMTVLSHACAETFTPLTAKNYLVGSTASAPNNTPAAPWGVDPAATMRANSDIKAIYSGFDCGANTYTVSLNTILQNYTQWPWGSYPVGGWEYTKKGPVCVEFHAWQYITNDSTGHTHGYVRCDMVVTALSPTGPYRIRVKTSQGNMWNTVPLSASAENFNGHQTGFNALVSIRNGVTIIQDMGGVNDPRTTTLTNANFVVATKRYTSAAQALFPQTGFSLSSTGSLPTGLSTNTPYWFAAPSAGANPYICLEKGHSAAIEGGQGTIAWVANTSYSVGAYRLNGGIVYYCVTAGISAASVGPTGTGTSIVDNTVRWANATAPFSDQGSGTITATPVYSCFASSGWISGDTHGLAIWSNGTAPAIFPGHDFTYLTTKSKFTLPYNPGAGFQTTALASNTYLPNQNFGGTVYAITATGDGAGDQRIGSMDNWGVVSLYNPADPYYTFNNLQGALTWANWLYNNMLDESGGQPFVGNNGHNQSGVPYTNFPSLIPAWNGNNTPGSNPTAIQARGATWSGWDLTPAGQSGFGGQYYSNVPGSHMPAQWQAAYLKTGEWVFLDMGLQMANTACFMVYLGKATQGGVTYYSIINTTADSVQMRAWGWGLRSLCQAVYICPASHPFQPVIADYYESNAQFQGDYYTNFVPVQCKALGVFNGAGRGYNNNPYKFYYHNVPWQDYFVYTEVAREEWRGGLTSTNAGNNWKKVRQFKDAYWANFNANLPNSLTYLASYDYIMGNAQEGFGTWLQSIYQTPAQCTADNFGLNGVDFIGSISGTVMTVTGMIGRMCNFTGSISGTTLTVTAVSYGRLDLGDYIFDGAANLITPKTNITAGPAAGGPGVYTVNFSQTVASEAMTAGPVLMVNGGIISGPGIFQTTSNGTKISSLGTGTGQNGTYNLSSNNGTVASQTMSMGTQNQPYPNYVAGGMYDQNSNGNCNFLIGAFPPNCNWYGNIARTALKMGCVADPSDTTVKPVILAAATNAIISATGVTATTGGIQWNGFNSGGIQNFQVFSCW